MNYLTLIQRFWQCNNEVPIGCNATALYFYLLKTCNSLGWKKAFKHADRYIALSLGISVNTVRTSRNKLRELGLIDFKTPDKGSRGLEGTTVYMINCIKIDTGYDTDVNMVIDKVPDTVINTDVDKVPDTLDKLNKTRQNNTLLVSQQEESEKRKVKSEKHGNVDFHDLAKKKFIEKEKSCAKKESNEFTPPTIEDVNDYISVEGYAVNGSKFLNYYTANGWMMGKNPMRDWKAAIRMWQSNDYGDSKNKQLPALGSGGEQGYGSNSFRNDADKRRAELDDLERLAETIIRQS